MVVTKAVELGRSVSAVRAWLAEGLIPDAYKLRDREWRVPPAGLRGFLNGQADTEREFKPALGNKSSDLGLWRKVRAGPSEP